MKHMAALRRPRMMQKEAAPSTATGSQDHAAARAKDEAHGGAQNVRA
jgi:hypothetical protein